MRENREAQMEARKQEVIRVLKDSLNNWSNEIPDFEIRGQGGKYKVRTAWFTGAFSAIEYSFVIYPNKELQNNFNEFREEYEQKREERRSLFKDNKVVDTFVKTTPEEIEATNYFIRRVLDELK